MAPPPKEQPAATDYTLNEIFKMYTAANAEHANGLVYSGSLFAWRRRVHAALLPVWKHETTLTGRRRFEHKMAEARVKLIEGGYGQSVDDLPTFETLKAWMLPPPPPTKLPFDPITDRSTAHSLAKGPRASISERTAARYGTTRRRWEADAHERWADEQGRAARRS
ncbi:hypothetical protein JCM8208_001182 [Rhodotorula glutinis]